MSSGSKPVGYFRLPCPHSLEPLPDGNAVAASTTATYEAIERPGDLRNKLPTLGLAAPGHGAVVVMVVRGLGAGGGSRRSSSSNQALDILRERFARGEIDKAEYEERRRLLEP